MQPLRRELKEIGPEACDGHISSSVYFQSIATSANAAFIRAYLKRFPDQSVTSADAEASYVAVHLLARALRSAGSEEITAVRSALSRVARHAPQGRVRIDSDNRHCFLTPRIGVSTRAAVSTSSSKRPAGETGSRPRPGRGARRPTLRNAGNQK